MPESKELDLKKDIESCINIMYTLLDDIYDLCKYESPEAENFLKGLKEKYNFT